MWISIKICPISDERYICLTKTAVWACFNEKASSQGPCSVQRHANIKVCSPETLEIISSGCFQELSFVGVELLYLRAWMPPLASRTDLGTGMPYYPIETSFNFQGSTHNSRHVIVWALSHYISSRPVYQRISDKTVQRHIFYEGDSILRCV